MTTLKSGVEGGRSAFPCPQFNLRNFFRQLTGTHLICLGNWFLFRRSQSKGGRSCDNAGAGRGGRPGSWVAGWFGGQAAGRLGGWAILTWEIAEGPLDHLRPWVSSCDIFLSNESSALRPETFAARGPCCFLYKRASGGRALGRAGGGRVVGWLGGPVAGWPSGQQAVALQAASGPSGRPGGDAASQVMPTRLGCSSPSTRLPLDFGHQLNPSPVSSWVGARQFSVARKHWGPSPANSQVVGLSPHVGRAGPS